jgi:hypothetical protein
MNKHCAPRLAAGIEEFRRCKAGLLAVYPELADDEQVLADTVDGETNLMDGVADLIRSARWDEMQAKALGQMIADLVERHRRTEARAKSKRTAALQVMDAIRERRLERPDFTATVMAPRSAVIVTDPDALPDGLCRVKREPDKTRIREALERGEAVEGACMANGSSSLVVRVK